eukprot:CAMPEP_0115587468 /NCGR_PEP_ID=MMETSP0272-20121206/8218_1 /TAXON_ID=71861 /ORGANISM="Scrippsiella trochoidea, Strain CCMP3099" /LENGTH=1062 /DNA_ID=CAMNT_0003022541 /DNA_START=46 /DNA_END=3233 /DNA_ORIENTATION=-
MSSKGMDVEVDAPPDDQLERSERRVKTIGHTLDPELRAILTKFDLDGNGIELKEVAAAAEQWAESKGDRGSFSLMAFPQGLRKELEPFDINKDGSVDKAELAIAAHMYQQTKNQARRMRVAIVVMSFVIILLLLGTFLLSYIAADLAKEMRAGGHGKLTTANGYVAATAEATEVAGLMDFPSLTMDVLRTAKDITVVHNGAAHYYVVGSIVKTSSEFTNTTSAEGELEEVGDVHITATSGQTISILANGSLIIDGEQVDLSESGRRLSSIEAQNSGTLAVQSSGPCKRWCLTKDKLWEEKCSDPWSKNCRGCNECSQDPYPAGGGCADTCQSDPLKWEKKCEWYECTQCNECGGGGNDEEGEVEGEDEEPEVDMSWVGKPCERWCLKEKSWEEKCANTKNCEGCVECHQDSYPVSPGCAAVCASDPLKWSVLCVNWWECSQCPQCAEGYNPSAHVPPPAHPIPTFPGGSSAPADVNITLNIPEGPTSSAEVSFRTGRACMVMLELPPTLTVPAAAPQFAFDGDVPAGLGINLRSGKITWQPDTSQLGSHTVGITIDTNTESHRLNLTLMVSFGANNPAGIYVWPVGGSDFNDGTVEMPFQTVSYAALMAEPGNTIYIRGGSYIVKEDIEFEGDPENRLLITRLPGERVRLIAQVFDVLSNTVGVTFRGFEVDGAAYNDHWTVLNTSWWRVNDEVLGGWNGFKIEGQYINVENCLIHDFNQKGIEIGEGRYVALHYNLIYNIGQSSLSGGGGIHRKWTVNFGTDDDPEHYRWDIFGNAVWSVEQRIYSFIPWKGYCLMEIDEGKPISVDSTRDKNMKARIAHNLVLYGGGGPHQVLVNPNLEVYNNMVMGEPNRTQPTPDGITVKGDSGTAIKCSGECIFGGYIEGLKLFNNLVHTGPGSIAFGMTDQFEESDNPNRINHNYFSGGGRIQPEYMPGLSSLPIEQSSSVFRAPGSEDYRPSDVLPEGVGVNQTIVKHLLDMARDYGVEIVPSGWRHDHCRMVQTIVGSYPTEHLMAPELGTSKYKTDHVAYTFKVQSVFYKQLCKCKTIELIFPEWLAEQCLHP